MLDLIYISSKKGKNKYERNINSESFFAINMLFVMKDVSESISGESKIPSNAVFIKLS